MASSQNIDIVIKAIDDASANIKRIEGQITSLASASEKASARTKKATGGVSSSFGGIGKAIGLASAAYAAFSAGTGLLGLTSQVEQSAIAFETLLGSQEKARKMLADIEEFAAKTPFEKANLTPLVQQLIGMGFAAEQTLPIVQVLGDSMSALGRGQDDLNGVVLALGQIQTKGKVSAEELMQLAERGLPVYSILEQKLGLTKKQLGDIGNAGIDSATGISALLTGLNEKFGGSMIKQSATLKGQWSNLLDNVKTLFGSAGMGINDAMKGMIGQINEFISSNWNLIKGLISEAFEYMLNAGRAIGENFAIIWEIVSEVLSGITGQTAKDTKTQMKNWSFLFMAISNGIIVTTSIVASMISAIFGGLRMLKSGLQTAADTVVGGIVMLVAASMAPLQDIINAAIKGWNILAGQIGGKVVDSVSFADSLGRKAAQSISASWSKGGAEIGEAWDTMAGQISTSMSGALGKLEANYAKYSQQVDNSTSKQTSVFDTIKKKLAEMAEGIGKNGAGHGAAAGAAKAHAEQLKKLKDTAEDALKSVIDRFKDTKKEIDDAKKKIAESTEQWKKFRADGVKALSDVNNEIAKLKKEAADINIKINTDRDQSLANRSVEAAKELKTVTEETAALKSKQREEYDPERQKDIVKGEKSMLDLAKEIEYIKANTAQKTIDEATAYSELSKAQQISADAEKERAKQLEENTKKQAAATEKQMILEAQAKQKNAADLAIQTGMKDGMMTASIELEKGKRVEIHDAENIALANDIAQKQAAFKTELDTLTTQLSQKLAAQKANISLTQDMYRQFNQYLKDDTKKTADEMTATLATVNAALRNTIDLRSKAGLASVAATGAAGTTATGTPKRAFGGPVTAGQGYQIGERGPEYFIPNQNGTVVPASQGGQTSITINMGGVSVRNDQDIRKIAEAIEHSLARKLQLGKLGIA